MVYKKSNRGNRGNYLSKNRSPKRKTLKRRNGIRNIQVAKRRSNKRMRSNKRKRSNKINIKSSKKRMRGGANLPGSPDYEAWEDVANLMTELSNLHKVGSAKFKMYYELAVLARSARIGTVEYNYYNLNAFKRMLEIYAKKRPSNRMPSVITFKGNRKISVVALAVAAERAAEEERAAAERAA